MLECSGMLYNTTFNYFRRRTKNPALREGCERIFFVGMRNENIFEFFFFRKILGIFSYFFSFPLQYSAKYWIFFVEVHGYFFNFLIKSSHPLPLIKNGRPLPSIPKPPVEMYSIAFFACIQINIQYFHR